MLLIARKCTSIFLCKQILHEYWKAKFKLDVIEWIGTWIAKLLMVQKLVYKKRETANNNLYRFM